MSEPFSFYENTLCLSFTNKDVPKKTFMLSGNHSAIASALVEQMEKHKEVADIINEAAINYALLKSGM